jgi:hypothetical protein
MADQNDAQIILKLFELRREEKMRAARKWFFAFPWQPTYDDFMRIAPPGSDENAYFRMVVTYWDMAASFVAKGILDRDLFYVSNNQELLFVYLKMQHLFTGFRSVSKNNLQYKSLEDVGHAYAEWTKGHSPEMVDVLMKRARGAAPPLTAPKPS